MHPRRFAAATPDKPAYAVAGSGEQVSYGEPEAHACQVAHWPHGQGIRTGNVVTLRAEDHPRFHELIRGPQRIAAQLDAFARQGPSAVKVPQGYVFRETLKRDDAGKSVKQRLREALIAGDSTRELAA